LPECFCGITLKVNYLNAKCKMQNPESKIPPKKIISLLTGIGNFLPRLLSTLEESQHHH